jgi:hypothetical protein
MARVVKVAQSCLTGGKSLLEKAAGKSPHLNFLPGNDGAIKLRVRNPRQETIIVERIEASPPVLGFMAGQEIADVVRAVVDQQQVPTDEALAVVHSEADTSVGVITFDPFDSSSPGMTVKVRLHWRSATRGMFSKRIVTCKITVRDIRDLKQAAERTRHRF